MNRRVQIITALHILFWISNLLRNFIFAYFENSPFYLKFILADQSIIALIFYINYLFILPFFFKKGNIFNYLLWFIFFLFFFTFTYGFFRYLNIPDYGPNPSGISLSKIMRNSFIYAGVIGGLYLLNNWLKNLFINKELITRKTETEIQVMRSVINIPMIIQTLDFMEKEAANDPHKIERPVLQLSNLLRYGLYDSQIDKVLLSKEIEILNNYISLSNHNSKGFELQIHKYKIEQNLYIPPYVILKFIDTWKSLNENYLYGVQAIDIATKGNQILVKIPLGRKDIDIQIFKEKIATLQKVPTEVSFLIEQEQLIMTITNFYNEH